MEDIDLTMLARSAYRAILRSIESPEAEEPETVKEVVPVPQRLQNAAFFLHSVLIRLGHGLPDLLEIL